MGKYLVTGDLKIDLDDKHREQIIGNFTKIDKYMDEHQGGYTDEMSALKAEMNEELRKFKEDMQKEIRAIIAPND
ncbi:hypothetical protein FEZ51_02190 [Pediococcus stilesii]|uniref:Uncharacterized protein n=1 Tax=Pediococcus stilesii TaxID=331679 RepID=A0A5R9BXW5_9LACO|nr:hypothetical protein [Pediococcus stilesii]TLQ05487.1 hypothetical protein FEZ51_02190 [Pediococcus stilesii]